MGKIELYKRKEQCCGCSACMSVCPQKAIKMVEDEEGFLYPEIDETLCIECGACKRVCSFHDDYKTPQRQEHISAYGVKHKNTKERETSRSGGVFVAIADYVLALGGIVYGAALNHQLAVEHIRVEERTELRKLKGSKYVQSDMKNIFEQVYRDLQEDKYVLFSGTGCQVAGLLNYVPNKWKEKLITCDIVCHGVPSPRIWQDYLHYMEKQNGKKIVKVDFRDKSYGWNTHYETLYFDEEGREKVTSRLFASMFNRAIMLRPSCGECHFTNLRRVSDFTLADFWGIENVAPEFNDNRGVSLLLVNTQKATDIFSRISEEIEYIAVDIRNCMQPNLVHPSKIADNRDKFWSDYYKHGYEYCVKKYNSYLGKFCRKFKNCVRTRYDVLTRKAAFSSREEMRLRWKQNV